MNKQKHGESGLGLLHCQIIFPSPTSRLLLQAKRSFAWRTNRVSSPSADTHTHTQRELRAPPRKHRGRTRPAPHPEPRFRHTKNKPTRPTFGALPQPELPLFLASLGSAVADKIRLRLTSPCYSAKLAPPAAARTPGARNNSKLSES